MPLPDKAFSCGGTFRKNSKVRTAIAAVTTSIKNMTSMVVMLSKAPLTIGDNQHDHGLNAAVDAIDLCQLSSGTICGTKAPTLGICTAAPTARIADTTKSSHMASWPLRNSIATPASIGQSCCQRA